MPGEEALIAGAANQIKQMAGTPIALGLGISKIFGGKSDYKKNKELLDQLKDPFYKIQDEYYQNRNLAASQAETGMGQPEQDYYTTESQRGLGSSLAALDQGGGSPNYISDILDTYNRGIRGTAAQSSQMQQAKFREYYDRNKDLAGQKTIQWHLNEYQPNINKRALYSNNMMAAKQNQTQGWSDILGAISASSTASLNQDMMRPANGSPAPVAANPANGQLPYLPDTASGKNGFINYMQGYTGGFQ